MNFNHRVSFDSADSAIDSFQPNSLPTDDSKPPSSLAPSALPLGEILSTTSEILRVRQVVLGVGAKNKAAIALYTRFGFESFGVERDYLFAEGEYHDEMHMIRFVQTDVQ